MSKKIKMTPFLFVLVTILSLVLVTPVFAADLPGEGTGVGSQPPTTMVFPSGANPPGSSTGIWNLDSNSYLGSVTWALATLYTDKWFKTSDNQIKVNCAFNAYASQADATNRINPLSSTFKMRLVLVDSNGYSVSSKNVPTDGSFDRYTFDVTPNQKYYFAFVFNGDPNKRYYAGDFHIYVD